MYVTVYSLIDESVLEPKNNSTKAYLCRAAVTEWEELAQQLIVRLLQSMPNGMRAVFQLGCLCQQLP